MSQYILQSLNLQTNKVAKKALTSSGKGGVKAQLSTQYLVIDEATGRAPRKQVLRKKGKDLIVEVDGEQVGVIRGFYEEAPNGQMPTYRVDEVCNLVDAKSLEQSNKEGKYEVVVGGTGQGSAASATATADGPLKEGVVYHEDASLCAVSPVDPVNAAAITSEGLTQAQMIGLGLGALLVGGAAVAIGASGGGGGSNSSTPTQTPVGDLIITGVVAAGPVSAGVTLYAYDATGTLLGQALINSDGSYRIAVANKGNYRGTILLKASDSNASAINYLDEATGATKSLDTELRAIGIAEIGQASFTVSGLDAHAIINITPLTELSVRQLGISTNVPVGAAAAMVANSNVAMAFGLTGIDITGNVITTNSPEFNATLSGGGLSDAEKYGLVLAKLSGLDSLNSGSMGTSLSKLQSALVGSSLSSAGALLVDQGRATALANLKANGTTFNAGSADSDINTSLNRQLLGEVIITGQSLDGSGNLTVSGTALPRSTVVVSLPDQTTRTVTVSANGTFNAVLVTS